MKRYLWIAVLLALVIGTPGPVAAQGDGDCDIRLADIYRLLAEAQAAIDSDDTAAALERLDDTRTAIDQIMAECAETVDLDLEKDPYEANPIIMYAVPAGYRRFVELAEAQGINLTIADNAAAFTAALADEEVTAAIVDMIPDETVLSAIGAFTERGGRVFFIYGSYWDYSSLNELMAELYDVTFDLGSGMPLDDGTVMYHQAMLPEWLYDYDIGVTDGTYIHLTDNVLAANDPTGVRGFWGESLLYFEDKDSTIIFWPRTLRSSTSSRADSWSGTFFADPSIESFDNEAAALALLEHLLE